MRENDLHLHCPVSIDPSGPRITLGHGEGGRLTRRLIDEHIVPRFDNPKLRALGDAAALELATNRIAVSTDAYVVSPLFFPGGDIGSLAVFGTVNDLAVSGAVPVSIALSLIIEEGLPFAVLDRILDSIADAARRCAVEIVTGDTKVVPRGVADGLFITTTGIGTLTEPIPPGPTAIQEGDAILVSGPIGRHGIAVMTAREQLAFDPPPKSDSAPLNEIAAKLREAVGSDLRAMRDATRGGVSAVLQEWSSACKCTIHVREADLPVTPEVRAACELLGLDPIYVANEGTMLIAVAPDAATPALAALQSHPTGREAAIIGTVTKRGIAPVTIARPLGPDQPLDEPSGAPLPRIC